MEGVHTNLYLTVCLDGGSSESDDPPLFGWREQ